VDAVYMLCSLLFIFSLSGLSTQQTARTGNFYGILSMTFAIVSTLFLEEFNERFIFFIPSFAIGGLIGLLLAVKVEMIDMPQMVATLHSFVGIGATLVSYSKFLTSKDSGFELTRLEQAETYIGVFFGAFTFTGSVVAWGKLQGVIRSSPLMLLGSGRHVINLLVLAGTFTLAFLFVTNEDNETYLLAMTGLSLFLGWHLIMAIGGADMPVAISMLNSYSGWTTSASGFLLKNNLMIITGALVGSSGAILSYIMCKAMNRSFFAVIMGGFGQGTVVVSAVGDGGVQRETNCTDFVSSLLASKHIIIVPGYGMAVAKAQHDVGRLADILRKQGKVVKFCIHPVAGRLPGHMNVLLAEANVPYDIVLEMDELNPEFPKTDLVLVIGANDTVNPDALENPNSAIAGMPVCEVWKAKSVVIFKRGGGSGYAGIENPLFTKPNSLMFFGSADKSVQNILSELEKRGATSSTVAPKVELAVEVAHIEEDLGELPEPKMVIGIPAEVYPNENRVAMTPKLIRRFRKLGFVVRVEQGAGEKAGYRDEDFHKAGAEIVDTKRVWSRSDIILKVRKPMFNDRLGGNEHDYMKKAKLLVSYIYPAQDKNLLNALTQLRNLTVFAMDCVPRITRAQKLDSLSSMGNIAGYRAVVEAFNIFQKCPKAQVTAAGKLPPTKVFILGCGVAGLAAIGYCKSLGCIVRAFDVRAAAREQAESLGAEFIEVNVKEEGSGVGGYAKEMSDAFLKAQMEMTLKIAKETDVVITTALIPGRPAPKLLPGYIVREMQPGSVVVDMAAEMGGNCDLTQKDRAYIDQESGVHIVGYTDLVSRMANQSSELYATNLWHLMDELGGGLNFRINMQDEIVSNMAVVHNGSISWVPIESRPPPAQAPQAQPKTQAQNQPLVLVPEAQGQHPEQSFWSKSSWCINALILGAIFLGIAKSFDSTFLNLFLIFVLAIVIGYMVVWNVTAALHTPLMSVTNAISGIIVIGAMLELTPVDPEVLVDQGSGCGFLGVLFSSINVVGGFLVTLRMLKMFRRT